MSDHTPTPWWFCEESFYIKSEEGNQDGIPTHIANVSGAGGEMRANAAHIVHCVNAHADLLAALEEIRPMADNASYSIGTPVNTLIAIAEIATAALAKARGTDETQ